MSQTAAKPGGIQHFGGDRHEPIRAAIVMGVPFFREGLKDLLDRTRQVRVVGVASDAQSAAALVASLQPQVVLLDDSAESMRVLQALRATSTTAKTIALAVSETPETILRWAECGIAAYVPNDATLEQLVRAIIGAIHDELYCSPRIAASMMRRVATLSLKPMAQEIMTLRKDLSPREFDVASLIGRGYSNKAIASQLEISPATAKNHVHHILEKLKLRNRSQLAVLMREP